MQIIKSGIIVAFFTLLSRILGYIRDILMASYLGLHIDAFAVAFRLPNTFRTLFAEGAFSSAFVPMFSSKLVHEDKKHALHFAGQVYSLLMLILAIFVGLMLIFMPQIIHLLAPGFVNIPEKLHLTITLAYFTTPYLFFIALASLYAGVLNSCSKFGIAAALPIILNLVMIFAIKFLTPYSASASHALSYGVLLAGICQFLVIIYAAHLASIQIKITRIVITDDIKLMFKNMIPAIIGSGVVQINLAIDTIIASFIDGAASTLYFADRLNQFPLAMIGTALSTVLLPTLSKQIREKQNSQAISTQNKALEVALFFALPCAFAFFVISPNLVSILLERGNFTSADSIKVAYALMALSFGLPAFVMIKIFTPRYFAEYDTSTPVRISVVCIILNIVFSVTLIQFISYLGIAVATSVSAWINVFLLYYFQKKRKLFLIDKNIHKQTIKIIFACVMMCFTLILFEYLTSSHVIAFIIEIILGMSVYFIISYYLKIIDLNFLRNYFKKAKN